jgi:hypothetical protein
VNGLWRRASFCCTGECVEVQITESFVFVRNSEGGPVVTASRAEWDAFCAGVAAGEFNLPEETQQ